MEEISKKFVHDEIQKALKELKHFSQQRSHILHTSAVPTNNEGINGEVRLSNVGGVRKIHTKIDGTWSSTITS